MMALSGAAVAMTVVLTASPDIAAQLNPRIGPANEDAYRDVLDARNWRNPKIVVFAEGVQVTAEGTTRSKPVTLAALRKFLIDLPVAAWPYGRVIAVSYNHLLPVPYERYQSRMSRRGEQVKAILKELQSTAEFWP
jgi:hypothetical protein